MRFDLTGENPENEKGEYFGNNIWWWRPLWDYIVYASKDILTPEDRNAGDWNDNYLITDEKAIAITDKLNELVIKGETARYSRNYKTKMKKMPDKVCDLCKGLGKRDDQYVKGECNGCHGTGKVRPSETLYPFSIKNVKEFITFAKNSGGFRIG